MELIAWCWMLLAFSLVAFILGAWLIALIIMISSAICFTFYFRSQPLDKETIIDYANGALKVYRSV